MTTPRCPICDKSVSAPSVAGSRDYAPFCCKRCADVDLQRWFTGRYAIPGADADEGDGRGPEDSD